MNDIQFTHTTGTAIYIRSIYIKYIYVIRSMIFKILTLPVLHLLLSISIVSTATATTCTTSSIVTVSVAAEANAVVRHDHHHHHPVKTTETQSISSTTSLPVATVVTGKNIMHQRRRWLKQTNPIINVVGYDNSHHGIVPLRGGGNIGVHRGKTTRSVIHRSQPGPPPPKDGTVDHTSHVINLIKTIIGAGVLGIPAGMTASFVGVSSSETVVLIGSMMLLVTIGLLAANGFNTIGQVCRVTNSQSYAQAWNATVSSTTTIIPNIACVMVTFCTLITYSMVLADTIPVLIRPIIEQLQVVAGSSTGSQMSMLPYVTRTNVLMLITVTILLPLCLLRSLSALAPFSFVGICGMIYTGLIMTIRFFDQSYSITNGRFISTIEPKFRPSFAMSSTTTNSGGGGSNVAILVSMLSTAYMAHYNAPKFYWELKNRSAAKYSAVVYQSFIGAIVMMIVIASMGYLTFGTNSQSLILNNYSTSDQFMSLSRWAVVLSLIFSYPLAFVGVRDGVYNLLQIQPQSGNINQNRRTNQITTVTVLGIITFVAAIMKDIRIILSLGGATFGNLLSYVFPAFLIVGLAEKNKRNVVTTKDDKESLFPTPNQVRFAILTAVLGVMMGIVGTIKAIQAM